MPDTAQTNSAVISSDRVNGTEVYGVEGGSIGHIDHLLIDKKTGRITYAMMGFGGFMGLGEDYYRSPNNGRNSPSPDQRRARCWKRCSAWPMTLICPSWAALKLMLWACRAVCSASRFRARPAMRSLFLPDMATAFSVCSSPMPRRWGQPPKPSGSRRQTQRHLSAVDAAQSLPNAPGARPPYARPVAAPAPPRQGHRRGPEAGPNATWVNWRLLAAARAQGRSSTPAKGRA